MIFDIQISIIFLKNTSIWYFLIIYYFHDILCKIRNTLLRLYSKSEYPAYRDWRPRTRVGINAHTGAKAVESVGTARTHHPCAAWVVSRTRSDSCRRQVESWRGTCPYLTDE